MIIGPSACKTVTGPDAFPLTGSPAGSHPGHTHTTECHHPPSSILPWLLSILHHILTNNSATCKILYQLFMPSNSLNNCPHPHINTTSALQILMWKHIPELFFCHAVDPYKALPACTDRELDSWLLSLTFIVTSCSFWSSM